MLFVERQPIKSKNLSRPREVRMVRLSYAEVFAITGTVAIGAGLALYFGTDAQNRLSNEVVNPSPNSSIELRTKSPMPSEAAAKDLLGS